MFQADPERNRDATLLHYGRILRKRQFAVYLFTLVMLVTVTVGTMLATPYYSSRATIEISPEPPTFLDVDEVAELVSGSSMDQRRTYYYTQYRVLESRTGSYFFQKGQGEPARLPVVIYSDSSPRS